MKKTYLLCLANSKKYGERCIAGIELVPNNKGQFFPLKKDGLPKWLRPVTGNEHGQVPARLVQNISVGDILEMQTTHACPIGYQAENIYFEKRSIKVVRPAELTCEHLSLLVENDGRHIFDNSRPCVTEEEIQHVTRSLILIKTEKIKTYFCTPYGTKPRVKFLYKKNWYNFPITDVNFIDRMQENPELLDGKDEVFLTVSLGVQFEGRYWKLAAGVVLY